ncbi:DUF4124 domain-containing protein [Halomonas sp. McH1-25]|uniref:DUF4124 domain-containing protein n=1 Tax=unclassified Halomonas TaxID=2609666 RepID=UPI001EF4E4C1|nr:MULTISPECIES: DUF4124 domain-containing protein [unclassified Halomonas]MCG7599971.1 DUF4124 domain-containing protein [Halomonas sp. McH1-25]MCP1343382.1 DUF4124 domain-containing protein [Halomonas sp. FL8]MCP1360461.1 DUF4124 domain-containing protein [Halomonas sp. BBD45]MCP1366040.1 DUF4124 domain-containing protein [Halomonas sp. BBD48]
MWRLSSLLLGILLPWASLEAATVYRYTDEQGNVVFTDQPRGNSERIKLEPLTVVPSLNVETPAASSVPQRNDTGQAERSSRLRNSESRPGAPFMPYSTFQIASPQDEATLQTGYGGNVQVELDIDPDLRPDHRVRLLVEGEISQSAMHTKAFMLTNLNRGEHVLQAELLDAAGQVRHRSAPVTLYVHRASVNSPANPSDLSGLPLNDSGR